MVSPKPRRMRLDAALVERGLAPNRSKAAALIMAGAVRVDGARADKAGASVTQEAAIDVVEKPHPYAGRGGLKLQGALETSGLNVTGMRCLDVGASTGGFTHCLLLRGAEHVTALDVGHGQMDSSLRGDARVRVLEGVNARYLDDVDLGGPFDLIVMDVSFISATKILPCLPRLMKPSASVFVLVKPQFELSPKEVGRGGVVRDEALQQKAVEAVRACGEAQGLRAAAVIESSIRGAGGNREFFILFTRSSGEAPS